tara:strand:- start:282 stop:1097 length:816 start_codon:yes stop_codon:yes gene_type:complete
MPVTGALATGGAAAAGGGAAGGAAAGAGGGLGTSAGFGGTGALGAKAGQGSLMGGNASQRVMTGAMKDGSQARAAGEFAKGALPSVIGAGGGQGQQAGMPNLGGALGMIHPALGIAYGAVKSVVGLAQKRKAEKLRPDETDPMRVSAMHDFKRKANTMFTGSAMQSNLRDIMQGRGGAYKSLARQGGPNVLRNMQLQSRLEGQQLNQLLGQAQTQEKFYEKMFQQEMSDIEERRLAIQSQKFGEVKAKSEANMSGGLADMAGGIGQIPTGK